MVDNAIGESTSGGTQKQVRSTPSARVEQPVAAVQGNSSIVSDWSDASLAAVLLAALAASRSIAVVAAGGTPTSLHAAQQANREPGHRKQAVRRRGERPGKEADGGRCRLFLNSVAPAGLLHRVLLQRGDTLRTTIEDVKASIDDLEVQLESAARPRQMED